MEFIGLPIVQILLVAIIFLAIMVEVKTGGMGIGALFGLIGAGVFFGSQFVHGLVSFYEIAVFLGGILFVVIELLTPGVGIFAAIGIVAIFYSFVLALGGGSEALYLLAISLLIAVLFFALILKRLPSSKLWAKVVLKDMSTAGKGYVSTQNYADLLGREGVTLTKLRPAGAVDIGGRHIDVVSEGQYIEKGVKVSVIYVSGSRIVVHELDSEIQN